MKNEECRDQEESQGQENVNYYDELLSKESTIWAPVRLWERRMGFVTPIIWKMLFFMLILHISFLWYIIDFFYSGGKIFQSTYIFTIVYYIFAGFGITAGAHRLWSHRAFKVKNSAKIIMLVAFAAAGQFSIYRWVQIHRVHHRKTDTSADPHDITRGFFFAHMGWSMMKRHPHVKAEIKKVDMSDIAGDPMITLYDRYYYILLLVWCIAVPTLVPVYLFGETVRAAIAAVLIRTLLVLHAACSINSVAHTFGSKPYNKNIAATDSVFAHIMTLGEGSHNFHHTFPSDYKSIENSLFCITSVILETLKVFGLIYDTKQVSQSFINYTANEKGDGNRNSVAVDE